MLDLDLDQRSGRGFAAHHRVARRRPGKEKARIVGFAAHGVVAGAERAADDHRDFRHHGIGDRVHHLGAGADDAAPLGVAAHHEAVHVVQEDQRNHVLVAVHDEARGLLGAFGIDDAAELDAPVALMIDLLHVQLLVGHDADGIAADARVAAQQRLAILGLVLVEVAAVDNARDDLAHVVLRGRIAVEDSVKLLRGVQRGSRACLR